MGKQREYVHIYKWGNLGILSTIRTILVHHIIVGYSFIYTYIYDFFPFFFFLEFSTPIRYPIAPPFACNRGKLSIQGSNLNGPALRMYETGCLWERV